VFLRASGIALAALAAVVVAYSSRLLVTLPAEAVGPQEQKKVFPQEAPRSTAREPGEADHPPVEQPPAPIDTWTAADVIAGLEECDLLLTPLRAGFDISKPIRVGLCGAPAPILLRRVAGVDITPPTLVNCRVAAKLHAWVETTLQPLAQSVLGQPVSRIVSASGYACRQRIGSTSGKQSEHSYANAFDVAAFMLQDGRTVGVLTAWGPTARDLRAQVQLPAEDLAGGHPRSLSDSPDATEQDRNFLRKAHESACGVFTTVLGPEANEAHRNHLHLDLALRRGAALCE